MEENMPSTDQTKSAFAAAVAAHAIPEEQKVHFIGMSSREDSELIASLKIENKKLTKQLAEKNDLLSKNTFEGELVERGLPIPLIVQVDRSTGRATITRK